MLSPIASRFGSEKNNSMYSRLRLTEKYLRYYLTAANGKGHGVHSPFVYDLVRNVLCDRTHYAPYARIEELRRHLLKDDGGVKVEDMGAGSVWSEGSAGPSGGPRVRTVASIARHAAKPARMGQLLFRLARYYRPAVVVELGTSVGLSAAYLAAGHPNGKVWTIEGSAALAERAAGHLSGLGLDNVNVVTGNFDAVLRPLMAGTGPADLAFVDGNHRYEPTLRYFDILFNHAGRSAILIFDDIHWSAEMENAWAEIKADPRVMMTIDLFFLGLVVLREEFKVKQDFTIRF
jgi:predicted O-methyltransferase YrrM